MLCRVCSWEGSSSAEGTELELQEREVNSWCLWGLLAEDWSNTPLKGGVRLRFFILEPQQGSATVEAAKIPTALVPMDLFCSSVQKLLF